MMGRQEVLDKVRAALVDVVAQEQEQEQEQDSALAPALWEKADRLLPTPQ